MQNGIYWNKLEKYKNIFIVLGSIYNLKNIYKMILKMGK